MTRRRAHELGSEAGIFLAGGGPLGAPDPTKSRHHENRVLQQGDVFAMLVRSTGRGDVQVGRTSTLEPIPRQLQEEFEFTMEAQRFTLEDPAKRVRLQMIFARRDGGWVKPGRSRTASATNRGWRSCAAAARE